jgi:hypothetical protein
MFFKKDPTSEVEVIEDVAKIRGILRKWQIRILKPEYIWIPPQEEGDIVMWDNWSVFHSAVDYPISYGPRSKFESYLETHFVKSANSPQLCIKPMLALLIGQRDSCLYRIPNASKANRRRSRHWLHSPVRNCGLRGMSQ